MHSQPSLSSQDSDECSLPWNKWFLYHQDKGHRNELEAFIAAVTGKVPSPLSFTEIAATTLATLRIQQSVATGGALKVDLPGFLQTNRATYEPAP